MLQMGWQEWISLPDLGLIAIKAKADTGAKTSALHAEHIVLEGSTPGSAVTFSVRPARTRPGLIVRAKAPLADIRQITSSNGTVEQRPVILTTLDAGGHKARIEITLTDRSDMSARMLLGRQALKALKAAIDPSATFLMPKLSYKLYPGWRSADGTLPRRNR